MQIKTKYLGELEIDKSKMIHFHDGIPGFNDEKKFIILNLPGNDVFQVLQSTAQEHIAFIITNPYHFYLDYSFELDEATIGSLEIKQKEDVIVNTIVTLKDTLEQSTINLKAPIVINSRTKLGKQLILNDDQIPIKAPLNQVTSQPGRGV